MAQSDSTSIHQVDSLIEVAMKMVRGDEDSAGMALIREVQTMALNLTPPDSGRYATALFTEGWVHQINKEYAAAEESYLTCLSIRESLSGRVHAQVAKTLYSLGWVKSDQGLFEEAEPYYKEALAIRNQILERDDPDRVTSLNGLANLYYFQGKYTRADSLYLEVREIRERTLGKMDSAYANILGNLALSAMQQQRFEDAKELYQEVLAIQKKNVGEAHPDYAKAINDLAILLQQMGHYEKANELYRKALDIREATLGEEDVTTISTVLNLGSLMFSMGRYRDAETYFIQANKGWEATVGPDHPHTARSKSNLASLYVKMGLFNAAGPIYQGVLQVFAKTIGEDHQDYIRILSNLAAVYRKTGNLEEAERIYDQVLEKQRAILGQAHLDVSTTLINRANLWYDLYQVDEAAKKRKQERQNNWVLINSEEGKKIRLQIEELELKRDSIGIKWNELFQMQFDTLIKKETELGDQMNNLLLSEQRLNIQINELKQDEIHIMQVMDPPLQSGTPRIISVYSDYREALEIRERKAGRYHPLYAGALFSLAKLELLENTLLQEVKTMLDTVLAIQSSLLPENHPDLTATRIELARVYLRMQEADHAAQLLRRSMLAQQELLSRSATFLSQEDLDVYTKQFEAFGDMIYAAVQSFPENGSLRQTAYDHALFQKGFLLHRARKLSELAHSRPEFKETQYQMKFCQRRLAEQYSSPIREQDSELIQSLEKEVNELEKILSRSVEDYRDMVNPVDWTDVQKALPVDGVAIEMIRFKGQKDEQLGSTFYAALVLKKHAEAPEFIPLFSEAEMNPVLINTTERKAAYVENLYAFADRGLISEGEVHKSFYDLIWKPLLPYLEGSGNVYLASTGLMHRINLGAIALSKKEVFADRFNLIGMGCTRQLVAREIGLPMTAETRVLVMGGIQFDPLDYPALSADELVASRSVDVDNGDQGSTQKESWNFLDWTVDETSTISDILTNRKLKVELVTGSAATEEVIKQAGQNGDSPRIIHLATHGFFYTGSEPTVKEPINSASPGDSGSGFGQGESPPISQPNTAVSSEARDNAPKPTAFSHKPVFQVAPDPMIRSGLILAGGNYAWQHGQTLRPDEEDGILTAYEISQMNLSNTDLVVLAACETGLGDIEGNEGVYGLQRAFKIAGAKYLIMSLWVVPDRQTMEFMTTFYRNWLPTHANVMAGKEEKMTIPDAFHKTQLEMRDRFFNPYSWAGFVLVE